MDHFTDWFLPSCRRQSLPGMIVGSSNQGHPSRKLGGSYLSLPSRPNHFIDPLRFRDGIEKTHTIPRSGLLMLLLLFFYSPSITPEMNSPSSVQKRSLGREK
jgi:hypothetical protein